jgi:hypothetical protein
LTLRCDFFDDIVALVRVCVFFVVDNDEDCIDGTVEVGVLFLFLIWNRGKPNCVLVYLVDAFNDDDDNDRDCFFAYADPLSSNDEDDEDDENDDDEESSSSLLEEEEESPSLLKDESSLSSLPRGPS